MHSNFQQRYRPWIAIFALALSIFTVVSTEMLPIGLLSPIALSLQTTEGTLSLMISLPAFVAAIAAPIVLIYFANINRKPLLTGLTLLLLLANIISAIAPNLTILLFARFLLGICMGGIWTIAGGLAMRIVTPQYAALATSIIFGGVAAASVLGIPLGVYLGDLFNWQFAFVSMAILSLIITLLLAWSLPSLPKTHDVHISSFIVLLKKADVWFGLGITLFLVTGHFMGYTFVRPLLQTHSGFSDSSIGALLLIYGFLGIIGNFILGNLVARYLKSTILIISTLLTFSIFLFLWLSSSPSFSIAILLLWGFAYGAVSVSLMTWMFKVSGDHIEPATAIYIAIYNLAIALGSFIGGKVYDHADLSTVLLMAGITACLAVILTVFAKPKTA